MIHDVISNDTNHKKDRFLQKNGLKSLSKCKHGYKNVACLYLSNGARQPEFLLSIILTMNESEYD